jgi:hypothetical protein
MSPLAVSSRCVNPLPGPVVPVDTMLAPSNKSVAFVVLTAPLLVNLLVPVPATNVSTALTGSIPLYSKIRMSGWVAATFHVTVTTFAPAAAPEMFFA